MIDLSRIMVLDFETDRIEPRPKYPPQPVGYALQTATSQPAYHAFGHPSENNSSEERSRHILQAWWDDPQTIFLFHGAKFDISVALEKWGFKMLPWHRVHDTSFLLFLYDPHAKDFSLKPSAERLLGEAPEEKNELYEWIWEHRKELKAEYGGKIDRKAKSGESAIGGWIAKAPGGLVGRYACGDVHRTLALFKFLYPKILRAGMGESYDRERKLLPILMENERKGLRVDKEALEQDVPIYESALVNVENQMRWYLDAPDLSFDKDEDVAEVFDSRGVVDPASWVKTPTGKLSVSKENLPPSSFTDPTFAAAFGYRNRMVTCLKMFMQPWLEQAQRNRGYIHTNWNQVLSSRGGARSGRPSMTKPNLLNVSKSFEGRSDGYIHPPDSLLLPPLPEVRKYILADEGEEFLHRDFSGQEMRIFAHYESGELAQAYRNNPELDPHDWVKDAIARATGKILERTRIKNVSFARLYGGGRNAVYEQARCESFAEALEIMGYHDLAIPGRKILNDEIIRLIRRGEPVRTWGGRLYYVEPPSMVRGRMQSWEYKLINYLIQGSAADFTKEAINLWYYGGGPSNGARFLLTVYDEINISSMQKRWKENMEFLREIMNRDVLDVPMRSDGKHGLRWGALEKCA